MENTKKISKKYSNTLDIYYFEDNIFFFRTYIVFVNEGNRKAFADFLNIESDDLANDLAVGKAGVYKPASGQKRKLACNLYGIMSFYETDSFLDKTNFTRTIGFFYHESTHIVFRFLDALTIKHAPESEEMYCYYGQSLIFSCIESYFDKYGEAKFP